MLWHELPGTTYAFWIDILRGLPHESTVRRFRGDLSGSIYHLRTVEQYPRGLPHESTVLGLQGFLWDPYIHPRTVEHYALVHTLGASGSDAVGQSGALQAMPVDDISSYVICAQARCSQMF